MEVVVKDNFEVKGRVAAEYGATGVVVVFDLPAQAAEPRRGMSIVLIRPDGWLRTSRVGDTREHGGCGRSFFLEGLTKQDVPVGTRLRWGGRSHAEDVDLTVAQTA